MKTLYTILGLASILAFQACTAPAPSVAKKPTDPAGISKYNMTRCVGCHGTNYELNPLRVSDKTVAGMSKADIVSSLTALSKKDIFPQSVVFAKMKPHELTTADIAALAEKLGK